MSKVVLEGQDQSRDELIAALAELDDLETLTLWAQRTLPLKNRLSATDAQAVEAAFAARLSRLDKTEHPDAKEVTVEPRNICREARQTSRPSPSSASPCGERDRHHLKFVASQPVLFAVRSRPMRTIKFAELPAMGRKVSDKYTVPVCRIHHRDLHRRGNERVWWIWTAASIL